MTITTEKNLAAEAKLALEIARKNKKGLVLLVGSGPLSFDRINTVKESSTSDNIVHVFGVVSGTFRSLYHGTDQWVSIDLNRVDAIVDRDLSSLEEDILEGL